MTDSTRADFEAWLDSPSSHNPDTSVRKRSTAMERVFAFHAWQAATLAAQGKRQPLTLEQIYACHDRTRMQWVRTPIESGMVAFVRAIEATHGITATQQGKT